MCVAATFAKEIEGFMCPSGGSLSSRDSEQACCMCVAATFAKEIEGFVSKLSRRMSGFLAGLQFTSSSTWRRVG
jgi:hypothetical protein